MLQSIRDHTQGWVAGIIVSILILSFALWGISSYFAGGSGNSIVAKVNGIEISSNQLASSYERLQKQLQMQPKSLQGLSDGELKKRALSNLINTQILYQGAINQNFRVSSEQVDSFLETMPEFQVNGRFSINRFNQLLQASMYSASDFLELIKTTLLIEQPRLGLVLTSFALPNEVSQILALLNQERSIFIISLSQENAFKNKIVISDDAVNAYYQHHQNEFKIPAQVKVQFVEIKLPNFISTIHPSEAELKKFYADNSSSYNQEPYEKIKAKLKEAYIHQQAEEQFASAREKLANVSYEHPDTLEPVAKALNLPIQTSEVFSQQDDKNQSFPTKKMREIAFSDDVLVHKNNSDIIQIDADHVLVLRVISHTPAATLPLNEVKAKIISTLQTDIAQEALLKQATKLKDQLEKSSNLQTLVNENNLKSSSAEFITRNSTKFSAQILKAAFALPKPTSDKPLPSLILKVKDGYDIVVLSAIKNGNSISAEQAKSLPMEAENGQGMIEYDAYSNYLKSEADIVIK